MEDGKNLPEPTRRADKIALKGAELLDNDEWDFLSASRLVVRGVEFQRSRQCEPFTRVAIDDSAVEDLSTESINRDYREIFNQSFQQAMSRKRERDLAPMEESIHDDAYHRKQRKKKTWKLIRTITLVAIASSVALGGIGSCVYFASKGAPETDLSEVNEFGFRRGDIPYSQRNWEYPDDCFKSGDGYEWTRSLSSCRSTLARWERDGTVWVTWNTSRD